MKLGMILIIFATYSSVSSAKFIENIKSESLTDYLSKNWKLSQTQKKYLQKGVVLANSDVTTKNNQQVFKLKALAYHSVGCQRALRKLSLLEEYHNYIGFIDRSTYQEKSKLFTLRASHTLLPFPMIIHILVDRPTQVGVYPFVFPTGMFQGLRGEFEIKEFKGRCLFYAHSLYKGKKSKIPDLVVQVFSETLSKLGGELLLRKSK